VVYQDVTRQAKRLYCLKYVGALRSGLAYLSRCNSGWFYHTMVVACSEKIFPWKIIGVMVHMMEVRFGIRKTPFFGTINPEKMVNRIIYLKIHQITPHLPNIPCDDSSTLE
jgi:hypothetical protein